MEKCDRRDRVGITVDCKITVTSAQIKIFFRVPIKFYPKTTFRTIYRDRVYFKAGLVPKIEEMVPPLPPHKQQLAKLLLDDNTSPQSVADELNCSRRTVFRYKRNIGLFGQPIQPRVDKVGRPSIFTVEMTEVYTLFVKICIQC